MAVSCSGSRQHEVVVGLAESEGVCHGHAQLAARHQVAQLADTLGGGADVAALQAALGQRVGIGGVHGRDFGADSLLAIVVFVLGMWGLQIIAG